MDSTLGLAVAMMGRALMDMAGQKKSTRRQAIRWVLSTDFDPWAAALGHEPGAMRRKLFTAAGLPLALKDRKSVV